MLLSVRAVNVLMECIGAQIYLSKKGCCGQGVLAFWGSAASIDGNKAFSGVFVNEVGPLPLLLPLLLTTFC